MIELRYATGELIAPGDKVAFRGDLCVVEYIATEETSFEDQGPRLGVMLTSEAFGSLFVPGGEEWQHLVLVAKGR